MNGWDGRWRRLPDGTDVPPEEVAKFVAWICTPKFERSPRTQKELADLLGVAERTVQRWRKDPRVQELINEKLDDLNFDRVRIQEIIDAMHEQAVGGDTKAASLLLQYLGEFIPTTRLQTDAVEDLSDEALNKELRELVESESQGS